MRRRKGSIIIGVVIIAIVAWGIISRVVGSERLNSSTDDNAIIIVKTIKPQKSAANEDTIFPGSVQAWHEAPIYARTNGYLKSWVTDIGTPVKQGQLLATIETPEIDAQLGQAKADLATAEANNKLAQSTATRWKALLKTDSVSKQEADEKISDAMAKAALVASAKANVDRLSDLESFKHVVAPFDGIITARNTDTGALINSGSSTGVGPELFHIADTSKLRIYVQVPENYAPAITTGIKAELRFAEHPGKVYDADLIKSANAIDPVSRTLLAEFEADNKAGELFAGGYAEMHLKLKTFASSLRLPSNTLMFRGNDVQVAVVEAKDNKSHAMLKTVTMGRDFGSDVEIVTGLNENDEVILNPPDSLASGQQVKIAEPEKEKPKTDGNNEKK